MVVSQHRHNPWQPSRGYDSSTITFVNSRLTVGYLVAHSAASVAVQLSSVRERVGRLQRLKRLDAHELVTDTIHFSRTRGSCCVTDRRLKPFGELDQESRAELCKFFIFLLSMLFPSVYFCFLRV